MRLRQFTPRQPPTDIPVTQREWQPDPEVVITHDGLYARVWECEYDEPIFDSEYNNLAPPVHPKLQYNPNGQLTNEEHSGNHARKFPRNYPSVRRII